MTYERQCLILLSVYVRRSADSDGGSPSDAMMMTDESTAAASKRGKSSAGGKKPATASQQSKDFELFDNEDMDDAAGDMSSKRRRHGLSIRLSLSICCLSVHRFSPLSVCFLDDTAGDMTSKHCQCGLSVSDYLAVWRQSSYSDTAYTNIWS